MIFWSSEILEYDLAKDKLTSWEKTKYLIFHIAIASMIGPVYLLRPSYGPKNPPFEWFFTIIYAVIMVLVAIYGLKSCFKSNQKIDGKHFIERYTVLSLPISIKFYVIGIPLTFISFLVVSMLTKSVPPSTISRIAKIFIFPGIVLFYYLRVGASIRRVGQIMKDEQPGRTPELP